MLIIYNAKIHTQSAQHPVATALAIENGRILAIGEDHQIRSMSGRGGDTLDAGGRSILPGLVDSHIHLQQYALALQAVDCETDTRADCLERIAERASRTPPGEWILGHGWNQNEWPEGFGSAADLDVAAPLHPVYLTAKSLHAAWANSAAFRLAGITPQTNDPEGGRIGRDGQGQPDGILFENAMGLVAGAIPEPTVEQIAEAIRSVQGNLWRMGLTGLHDFDRQACFSALQILHANGELGLRVVKSLPLDALPHAVALGLRTGFGDDFLRIGWIKAFADGALGPRTAAMLQPYEGESSNRGMLLLDAEELFEYGQLAVTHGLGLAVHAIGDRANHEVLEAYAQLRTLERERASSLQSTARATSLPLRHRIEHVQIIHPDDAPRLADLGVIASMQPIHATSDFPAADRYWGERSVHSYAWRKLLDQGALLAFGSDAPVESPNPFWGLYAAVTRRRLDGSPGPEGWYPAQRLSLAEALYAYSAGAAYAAGMEDRLGKLVPGYLADLLILDTDPFNCDVEQLAHIRPLATMVAGNWVFLDLPLNDSPSSGAHPLHAR